MVVMAMMAASLLALTGTVAGAEQAAAEQAPATPARTWAFSLRWENDTFANTDRFYTNGIGVALSHTGPSWADLLFDWLPWGSGRRTVSYAFSQAMFTPEDTERAGIRRRGRSDLGAPHHRRPSPPGVGLAAPQRTDPQSRL
jgi:hypothetical protein